MIAINLYVGWTAKGRGKLQNVIMSLHALSAGRYATVLQNAKTSPLGNRP